MKMVRVLEWARANGTEQMLRDKMKPVDVDLGDGVTAAVYAQPQCIKCFANLDTDTAWFDEDARPRALYCGDCAAAAMGSN